MDIDWSTVVFVDVTEVPDSPSCVSGRHIAGTYALRPTLGRGGGETARPFDKQRPCDGSPLPGRRLPRETRWVVESRLKLEPR